MAINNLLRRLRGEDDQKSIIGVLVGLIACYFLMIWLDKDGMLSKEERLQSNYLWDA